MYIYVSLFFHVSWMEDPAKERYVCVEPFAAVLVFCSGFAPKLFILSSQCDRSTEKRYGYWYWTCIENKDGAITVSDLVWYFTHIYYILLYIYIYIFLYRYQCLYSILLSHIPTSIYFLPHETLRFSSTSPTTSLKAECLPEVTSEIEDQGAHWGCAQWRWTWMFVDQQDIRWSLWVIFLKRLIPVGSC